MLDITLKAIDKIKSLSKNATFRIAVMGGGCAGFQYDFFLDASQDKKDHVIEIKGIKVFVDDLTLPFIKGSSLEYVEELGKAGFAVKNPNAKSSCGCNNSFSI